MNTRHVYLGPFCSNEVLVGLKIGFGWLRYVRYLVIKSNGLILSLGQRFRRKDMSDPLYQTNTWA
jgi:hypothetical protein